MPDTRQCCVSWCPTCHGKERGAGRQTHGVAWTQVSPRSAEAKKISALPRHSSSPQRGIQRRRQTVLTAISATGDNLRAQPIRSAKPTRVSSVQIGRGLQKQNARSSRFESMLPLFGAAHANISDQGSAPRRVGPGPGAFRRIRLAARSSALVWGLGQSRQPLLWAHRQYLRL